MNPEFPQNERAKLEAKLTALLLGELHADEVASLSQAMEKDPELAELYERLKVTVELVREGAMQPKAEEQAPLKLSAEKREKLLASFKTVAPKEFAGTRRTMDWVLPWAAVATIAFFFGWLLVPNFSKTRETARSNTIVNNLRLLDGAKEQWALENNKSGDAVPTMDDLKPYMGRGGNVEIGSIAGEKYVLGKVSETPKVEASVSQAKKLFGPEVVSRGEVRDGKVIVSPLSQEPAVQFQAVLGGLHSAGSAPQEQMDQAAMTPPPQTLTAIFGNQNKLGTAPGATVASRRSVPATPASTTPIILPGQSGDQGKAPVQLMVQGGNEGVIQYARQTDISDALKQLADQQTNSLALNGRYWGTESSKKTDGQMALFGDMNVNGGVVTITNGVAPGAVAFNADSFETGRSYQTLSKLGADAEQGKWNWTIETHNKIGALTLADGSLEQVSAEGLKKAMAEGQAVRPSFTFNELSDQATSNATDKVPMLGDVPAVGRLFRSNSTVAQNGDFTTASTRDDVSKLRYLMTNAAGASNSSGFAVRQAYIAPPSASDGLLTAGLRGPTHSAEIIQSREQGEIVLPSTKDSWQNSGSLALNEEKSREAAVAGGGGGGGGGFGGGGQGSQNSILMQRVQQASGGKQVELAAAAARPSASSTAEQPRLQTVTALEMAKPIRDQDIQTSQAVQDGKLAFQTGKIDEAEAKMNEALARDPSNQGALYYLSLIKQVRVRQEVDSRNVTSMNRMVEVEKGWMDNDARAKLPVPQTARTNSVTNWWNATPTVRTFYNDSANSRSEPSNVYSAEIVGYAVVSTNAVKVEPTASPKSNSLMTHTFKVDANEFYAALKRFENPADTGISTGSTEMSRVPASRVRGINTNNAASAGLRYVTGLESSSELQGQTLKFFHSIGVDLDETNGKSLFFNDRQGTITIHATDSDLKLAEQAIGALSTPVQNATTAPKSDTTDIALSKPAVPPPTPQPEILTRENAFSTFSLNVSDVSFKLAAASLEKGQMPEPASIRSEEFINAFDYRDADAAPGVPIAFASERARYPFAHNRELLRFSLKTAAAGRQVGRPLNIVLLLDNSGSMERADRVTIIREALRVLAGQLQAGDTFSIVTFARTAQLRVDGIPGNQAAAAAEEIAKLTPEGGTNLGDALELAYQTALRHYLANGDNRVVLLTDGAANLGDVNPDALKQKVEAHRQQGVALDCFGIGWEGYNDDLLEVLTRNGDGRYGFINTTEDANTEFVAQIAGALHVAASDVKVQVEFNPLRVTSYRQIGYAKHQLTKEQFRDNTVDAAEIAAQEAGNALYTIEINPEGSGSIATVRVRYKVPGTAEYREQAWDVPFTGGAVALDQASPAMRLAATACAFSEWLATSPFAAEVSTEELLKYINGVPQVYGADGRPAKLEWMIRQARSISGK